MHAQKVSVQTTLQYRNVVLLRFIASTRPPLPPRSLGCQPTNQVPYLSVYSCFVINAWRVRCRARSLRALRVCLFYFVLSFVGPSPRSWKALLAAVNPDTSPLPPRFYRPAMMALGTVHFIVGSAFAIKVLAIVGGKPSRMKEVVV